MVFLDGVLLNGASGGGVDLSNISLSDVASIEIYKGVTPVNFGKASIGGVVNIKTLRSKEAFSSSVSAGYGSFHTRRLAGFVNQTSRQTSGQTSGQTSRQTSLKPSGQTSEQTSGKWDYLISGDYLGSDNDFEILNDNGTELNPADDRWEKRNNAEFDQGNILAKFGYDLADDLRIDLLNQWFSKEQELPAWNNSRRAKTRFDTTRNITTLKLTADNLGPHGFNTSTRMDYAWKEEEYDDRGGHVGLGNQHSRYTTTRYGMNFFLEWLTERNSWGLMLDAQHETYEPEDILEGEDTEESKRITYSIGLQDSLLFFQETLIITPALRYTFVKDELKGGVDTWEADMDDMSRDEDHIFAQIGAKYRPLDWLTFRANMAKYAREPSFFELFGDRGFFTGNMELNPEEGTNCDAGLEINWHSSNVWMKRISLNVAGFQSDVDDLISRVYDKVVGKSVNISSSRIQGIEVGVNLDRLKYFRISANATWQDTENKSETKGSDGKKLPNRFEESYMGRVEGRHGGFKIYAEYIAEKGLYYDSPNLLKAEDKEEINAGISWLIRSFLLTFDVKNLGDDRYEDFNGYPLPGRSYSFSVKHNF